MGVDALLRALKAAFERATREMRLKVNPDTGIHEEDMDRPLYPEEYPEPEEPPEPEEDTGLEEFSEMEENEGGESGEDGEEREIKPPRAPEKPPRAPTIYLMNLPDREDLTGPIPYIILQVLTGKDKRDKESGDEQSTVDVRALIATYTDDGQDGGLQVLEIIERIRILLEKGRLLDDNYMLQMPFDWEIYPDDTGLYYLGEINMTWSVPGVERTAIRIEDILGD